MFREAYAMLGKPAKDLITNEEGIITSACVDLYGCVQVILTPSRRNKDGETAKAFWYDVTRIKILSDARVIEPPDLSAEFVPLPAGAPSTPAKEPGRVSGPAEKPEGSAP